MLLPGILGDTTAQAQFGGVPVWTNIYNGPGSGTDQANAVAVDGSGNVFVTGYSYNGGNNDYATIKYSGAGVALWTNRYDGPGNSFDIAFAMAVDGSGNVFVTGYSTNADYATIKYSGDGMPLWTNRYAGAGNIKMALSLIWLNQCQAGSSIRLPFFLHKLLFPTCAMD